MLELVVSGGQTGADQSGWRAAKRFGIPTGGWMPKGFLTEDGPRPDFADLYGAKAHASASYRDRNIANFEPADLTMLFGSPESPGSKLTLKTADEKGRKDRVILIHGPRLVITSPSVAAHIVTQLGDVRTLNVAGNRESSNPGIGEWVEEYLCEVFRLLGHKEA